MKKKETSKVQVRRFLIPETGSPGSCGLDERAFRYSIRCAATCCCAAPSKAKPRDLRDLRAKDFTSLPAHARLPVRLPTIPLRRYHSLDSQRQHCPMLKAGPHDWRLFCVFCHPGPATKAAASRFSAFAQQLCITASPNLAALLSQAMILLPGRYMHTQLPNTACAPNKALYRPK